MATTPQEDELKATRLQVNELQATTEKATADRDEALAKAKGAEGERDAAQAALEAARREIEQLKSANQTLAGQVAVDGLPPIPDLPKGAFQLIESATVHSGPEVDGPGGKKVPRRLDLQRGNVVFVGGKQKDFDALQGRLGTTVRVTAVDEDCETDLRKLGAIR